MTAKRPPEARKEPKFRENAINYVDAQLATMAKYGSAPVLSPEEYYSLVDECEQVGRKIWKASEKRKWFEAPPHCNGLKCEYCWRMFGIGATVVAVLCLILWRIK